MSQEATKSEYAIAVAGLLYITAFTAAEQLAELGGFAYRRLQQLLGDAPEADARPPRATKKSTNSR
jgi:hypothetical protein